MIPKYKVAIICTTFNHEDYITDAIESFLAQNCSFDFQIIVHDDASSDQTASIVRSFEEKHPDKIFAIYQRENQYSKGVEGKLNENQMINDLIDSEYVAICEGDDYWINPHKLQIQVDFLDQNADFSASTHRAKIFDAKMNKFNKSTGSKSEILTAEDMIIGGGGIIPIASIVCRRDLYRLPPFGLELSIGDYQRQIFLALHGNIRNFKEEMSAYRTNVANSWTYKYNHDSIQIKINHHFQLITMLRELDIFTEHKYKDIILISLFQINARLNEINYRSLENNKLSYVYVRSILRALSQFRLENRTPSLLKSFLNLIVNILLFIKFLVIKPRKNKCRV